MTPFQIAVLSIRLLAIAGFVHTINNLHQLFAYANDGAQITLNYYFIGVFVLVQFGTWILLWFFPVPVARKLLPSASSSTEGSPSPFIHWQTVGVICIGLWTMARAIPDALYWFSFYRMSLDVGASFESYDPQTKAAMISVVAELLIGLCLLLGAKGFAALLFKVRTKGLK